MFALMTVFSLIAGDIGPDGFTGLHLLPPKSDQCRDLSGEDRGVAVLVTDQWGVPVLNARATLGLLRFQEDGGTRVRELIGSVEIKKGRLISSTADLLVVITAPGCTSEMLMVNRDVEACMRVALACGVATDGGIR